MAQRSRLIRSFVVLALIMTIGLSLRMLALGGKALWQDEGTSVYYAQLPVQVLFGSLCDPHPPGYYLVLRAVLAFGGSEWWVRLPSALGGVLAVLFTCVQARVMLRPLAGASQSRVARAALLAAGLVAVSPLHVWYSQEARPYALLSALALAMTTTGMWWWRKPGLTRAALYVVAGWLAFAVEYGALVAWVLLNLFLLSGWPWRDSGRRGQAPARRTAGWLVLQALALAPFAFWWLQSAQGPALSRPSYQAVFLAVQAQAVGLALTPPSAQWVLVGALVAMLLAGIAIGLILRFSSATRDWLSNRRAAGFTLAALLILLALWGVAPRLYSVKRHLVVFVPYLAIAVAWTLTSPSWLRPRQARGAAFGLLAACLALSLAAVLLVPKSAWREAVETLAVAAQPGDAIRVDEMNAPVFNYYWQDRQPWQPLSGSGHDALVTASPATRVWIAGDVSPYRNVHGTLPTEFAATHVVTRRFAWPGLEVRMYETGVPSQSPGQPSQALLWGQTLVSPLETDCR